MNTIEALAFVGVTVLLAGGLVFAIVSFFISGLADDVVTAVHQVLRRRLRLWARSHGIQLWEDAADD